MRNGAIREPSTANHPPEIPLRMKTTPKRMPYQDIALPSVTFRQTSSVQSNVLVSCDKPKPPPVLPKPVSPLPHNTPTSTKTMRPSPPPIPPKSQNPTIPSTSPPLTPTTLQNNTTPPPISPRPLTIVCQNPNMSPPPPPPPPPPPLPLNLFAPKKNLDMPSSPSPLESKQTTIQSPTSSEHGSLLEQIRNFNTPLKVRMTILSRQLKFLFKFSPSSQSQNGQFQ